MPSRKDKPSSQDPICLAFTLTAAAASKRDCLPLIEWLQDRGFHDISEGLATVSARIDAEHFSALFPGDVKKLQPRKPDKDDFGQPGGFETTDDLTVPKEITDYVRAVAVTPPAARLVNPNRNKRKRKG